MHRATRAVVFGILTVTISTAAAAAEDARWGHAQAGIAKPRTFGFSMLERAPDAAPDQWTITDYGTHG
jgi:hypothetical protein